MTGWAKATCARDGSPDEDVACARGVPRSGLRLRLARPRRPAALRAGADVAAVHVVRVRDAGLGFGRHSEIATRAQTSSGHRPDAAPPAARVVTRGGAEVA